MGLWQAIVLGVVQGVTEFLPISSSAHLILIPKLTGWPDQGLAVDVAANTGTLLAVLLYCYRELRLMALDTARWLRRPRTLTPGAAFLLKLGLATVPVAIGGLLLQDWVGKEARNVDLIAATSIGFGLLLLAADLWGRKARGLEKLDLLGAFGIGLAQAVALLPGTSRSGATITAGLALGLDRDSAARFSFLLAIPVGLLVAANDLLKVLTGSLESAIWLPMITVAVVAGVTGYLGIHALVLWVRRQSLQVFVVYRLLLGVLLLVLWH